MVEKKQPSMSQYNVCCSLKNTAGFMARAIFHRKAEASVLRDFRPDYLPARKEFSVSSRRLIVGPGFEDIVVNPSWRARRWQGSNHSFVGFERV